LVYFDEISPLFPAAFNLIEGIDVAAIEARIAKYQEENSEQIMINRARKVLVIVSIGSVYSICPVSICYASASFLLYIF
jgi:FMN-dependent NADH-azoreductase